MPHAVYKYPLALTDEQAVDLPIGAQLLSWGFQDNQPVLWALVDTTTGTMKQQRHIRICGTGHPAPHPSQVKFINTAFIGGLMFHAFERVGGQ